MKREGEAALSYRLLTFQHIDDIVLKNEYALVFVFLLNFESHVLLENFIVGLVNITYRGRWWVIMRGRDLGRLTEGALAKLFGECESV